MQEIGLVFLHYSEDLTSQQLQTFGETALVMEEASTTQAGFECGEHKGVFFLATNYTLHSVGSMRGFVFIGSLLKDGKRQLVIFLFIPQHLRGRSPSQLH